MGRESGEDLSQLLSLQEYEVEVRLGQQSTLFAGIRRTMKGGRYGRFRSLAV